ncbi:hypothetical protein IGI04_016951, partial [Brassica rapa subsp. trilocularis]
MERRVHREPPPLISITSSSSSSRLQISFPGICSSKRNRDRSCTTKVIDVASWPRINLSCCGAETVPTSPSVKAKRSTKTEAFSMEICQGIAAVFVCDQPAGEAILVDQMVADRSKPGGYGQGTYRTTFLPEGLKVYPNPHIRLFSESSGVVILEPEKSIRCFSGETDEYMIFGWIGATGLYFGFLFGLRVSGVMYMGYYAMRYCWWHAVLQIGVTTVDSGSKALEFLGLRESNESNDPNAPSSSPVTHQEIEINLIITDYCMPGMTGYDLLKRVKESAAFRSIPVVIMSSENVPARISRCLEEGAEEFFLKPVKLADLTKLKPHMMKTKLKKESENSAKEDNAVLKHEIRKEEEPSVIEVLPLHQEVEQEPMLSNNKRKAMEEVISTNRSRPKYNDITTLECFF